MLQRICIPALVVCLAAVSMVAAQAAAEETPTRQWKLVWSDEFDDSGLAAPNRWEYEVGMIRNREAQIYTDARAKNARVENGHLIIEAHKERFEGEQYTAASLVSKAGWKYGRVEVRAKIPTGRGMWPAIWMMPDDPKGGWPACGEIDIMENVGFEADEIHATVHTRSYNHTKGTQKGGTIKAERPYDQFYVYALEWNKDKIDFYLNDKKYFTFENEGTGPDEWPFDKAFHLKLNIAVGGSWGGSKGIDDSIFPQQLEIDYVRVYQ